MTNTEEFVIARTFDAPRDLVFKVYSEAEHLAKWWGPAGFEWIKGELDFRPGGRFHYCMKSPDGFEMWGKFNYFEIEAPERVVFTNSFSNADGDTVRAPFAAEFPLEVMNIVTFTEDSGKTTITLRGKPHNASPAENAFFDGMRTSMQQGFGGTFDQLDAYLKALA